MAIVNFREQMKIMRQGIDLYFDPKEKKKEGKGIEFPVKKDQSTADMIMSYRSLGNDNADQKARNKEKRP